MPDAALSDIRVIDLSQGIAGGYCTKLLADYGADVIKVEPPGTGDRTRSLGPFPDDVPSTEAGGMHLHLDTNKRSVTLDISTRSGQVILRKLLAKADVLVESERPGTLAEYRLGYDDLKGDFPDLVYCSISGFGQTGPYRNYQANSIIAMALSGIMYVTGNPDREPLSTGSEAAEYFAAIQAWIGILAALELRAREGGGDHLDVAITDSLAPADEYNTGFYTALGAIRKRFYSRHAFGYPNDIYPTQDGYIVVIPAVQGFPTGLALLVEQPELAEHELFTNGGQRIFRWREFDELILPYLRTHTSREILERAQELRMPFAPVLDAKTLLEDPHLAERGFLVEVTHPGDGTLKHTGAPFRLSETPMQPGPAPTLGGDNGSILGEVGYEAGDLLILRERGVI